MVPDLFRITEGERATMTCRTLVERYRAGHMESLILAYLSAHPDEKVDDLCLYEQGPSVGSMSTRWWIGRKDECVNR